MVRANVIGNIYKILNLRPMCLRYFFDTSFLSSQLSFSFAFSLFVCDRFVNTVKLVAIYTWCADVLFDERSN